MPSAILCSMPAQGHVRPMLAVATGLLARGWRVRFLTGAAFEAKVQAAGVEFLELPAEADSLHRRPGDERHSGIASLNHGIKQIFFDPAPAEFRALRAALRAEPADAVLHDTTFLGTAGLYGWPAGATPAPGDVRNSPAGAVQPGLRTLRSRYDAPCGVRSDTSATACSPPWPPR